MDAGYYKSTQLSWGVGVALEARRGFTRSIPGAGCAGGLGRVRAAGVRVRAVWRRNAEVLNAAGTPLQFLSQTL